MREITSSEQFSDALSVAVEQDKLVLVDFYSTGCGSCKAIYPKVKCQFSALLSAILKEIYYLYLYLSRNLEIFGQKVGDWMKRYVMGILLHIGVRSEEDCTKAHGTQFMTFFIVSTL